MSRPRETDCPPGPPRIVHTIRLDLGQRLGICVIKVYNNGEFEVSDPLKEFVEGVEVESHLKARAHKKK